ncbi:GerMN domain-containing protein [Alkalihalobacillus pseudalcaliphilus]|uniref:GerMN domain-containing protein n=1 Tax=Alkalihalobacillus pseudalcaliphilus TaxID=79884 RepID=UPI00069F4AE6|nr:GerMN domain-containing protein [Alkalihalobacillus pseudalcaliphilus]
MRKILRRGVPVLLFVALTATACSTGSDETSKQMDAPPVQYVDDEGELELDEDGKESSEDGEAADEEGTDEAVAELIEREVYLFDQNGLVVPQKIMVPKQVGVLQQSLEFLVEGGPVTDQLPSGFKAVLPAGTEMNVNLKDGVATANFTEEFNEYNPEMERGIVEAITWTLTQFDTVEKVKIQINGFDQEVMPKNQTPIGEGMSRSDGINLETGGLVNLVGTESVTLYFLGTNGESNYYVPVTRNVKSGLDNPYQVALEQLLMGPLPGKSGSLVSDIRHGVSVLDEPLFEDGLLTVNLSEEILSELESTAISYEALNMIALTLTEQEGVKEIAIHVDGEKELISEEGEAIETVSRPTDINTGKY